MIDPLPPCLLDRARALAMPGRRRLLGITGPPGSGKSMTADALAEELGSAAVVVGMDGFHLPDDELRRLGRADRKGAPDTFDVAGYVALLGRLRSPTGLVWAPGFDRQAESIVPDAVEVPASVSLVVTEGNYLLHDALGWSAVRALLDETWYLDADAAMLEPRLTERRVRHGARRAAATAWVRDVDLVNAALVAGGRHRADVVVRLSPRSGTRVRPREV